MTDDVKSHPQDKPQAISMEAHMECLKSRIRRLPQDHMESDARLNTKVECPGLWICELTSKSFDGPLNQDSTPQIIFHRQTHQSWSSSSTKSEPPASGADCSNAYPVFITIDD